MALTAYTRFRFLWGAIDYTSDDEAPTYESGNTEDNISQGANGRRVILRWNRNPQSEDLVQTHFDFVNITSGAVDDTWTTGDFTTLEGYLDTWWTAIAAVTSNQAVLQEYRWYRIGPGAVPPEPAVRVTTRSVAGGVSGGMLPPQIAGTVTFKTGLRKHWGRIYVPLPSNSQVGGTTGQFVSGYTSALANATHSLVTSAASSDFYLVVWSRTRQRMYVVEQLQVDDIPDVQRRRREKKNITRTVKP